MTPPFAAMAARFMAPPPAISHIPGIRRFPTTNTPASR
jgi:hypothetical protein